MINFPIRRIVQAAVVASVVAATVGFASFDKAVALSVDGRTASVHTFGNTVGDLLAAKHIKLGSHDLVAPSTSAPLKDGQKVTVRYGRLLTVNVDGKSRNYWTTATTVASALNELGIRADGARLSVSRSQPLGRQGLTLTVSTPKDVTVKADGKTRRATTTGATVRDALSELKIPVGPIDKVKPGLNTPLTAKGATIAVARVKQKTVTVTESIAPSVTERSDSSLTKGTTKTVNAGKPGSKVVTYAQTFVDGKLTSRVAKSVKVVSQPVAKVVAVGTKAPPAPDAGSIPSSGGLNWAGLAQCESGGNPRAVDPSGTYYGLYQFDQNTWQSVGGSGSPIDASSAEQTKRAQILYDRSGPGQWPVCGQYL